LKLSEIKQILVERDLRLTKSLGQNFLHDQNQIKRIAAAGELTAGDRVLEIGPGLGPLTESLVESAGRVLAIEKDERLFAVLREKFKAASNLELICGDALEYLKKNREWGGWKLISNLPYATGSPMLVELAQAQAPPERIVATLQIDVAERIQARAGCKTYGILTLLLQIQYRSAGSFKIPASCFFPAPNVDSACITLVRRAPPLLESRFHGTFVRVVKRSFSQRRKTMLKLLKADWPDSLVESALGRISLSPQARAEEASLEQFAQLTEILAGSQGERPAAGKPDLEI
jgi:16S rRNA (adenine1518-N6/adenine1519-N6)-dimethyltransferase